MSHNAQQSKVSASRLQRGASGERKTTEALARLHSARSFNHSHCFTAEGWGSSLTPLGLRSSKARGGKPFAVTPMTERPPSDAQIAYCRKLGWTEPILTAAQASLIISERKAQQAMR